MTERHPWRATAHEPVDCTVTLPDGRKQRVLLPVGVECRVSEDVMTALAGLGLRITWTED